jgi:hypothetical protein
LHWTGSIEILEGNILCTSDTYEFARAVDTFFDEIYWGWGYGGMWTDELESSLLELLVGVTEELAQAVASWQPMMRMIGALTVYINHKFLYLKSIRFITFRRCCTRDKQNA